MIEAFVCAFGLVFGSFYNVIIYRLPIDMSVTKGRSMCTSCKTQLRAVDLVPVFSWLFLKGKCRYCGEKISIRYPAVELVTGLLFLISYYIYGLNLEFAAMCSLWSMLLITAMIDWDTMYIMDSVLIVFTAVSAACLFFNGAPVIPHLIGAGISFGIYLTIYLLARLFYKREAFGFGDVLLVACVGLILGSTPWLAVTAAILPAYIAVIGFIIIRFSGKKLSIKKEVAFGPYICVSAFIVSLWGGEIVNIISKFMGLA